MESYASGKAKESVQVGNVTTMAEGSLIVEMLTHHGH